MSPARASGLSLHTDDIPIVLGMAIRGDRNHDIAAWFGVNQGRIKEAKDGKFGSPKPAPQSSLPPKGPPGVKGRRLRQDMEALLKSVGSTGPAGKAIFAALERYDEDEA